ncbi:MAG: hypothetical protein WDN26_11625 [Chitinophagaceae bacterium]
MNNNDKHSVNALLLIETSSGNIRKGNIVQYIPDQEQATSIQKNSFSKIFNGENFDLDAQFSFLTILDKLSYQVKYKDGYMQSSGIVKPGSSVVPNTPPQDPIGPAPVCTDWYLVTTYYYLDGSTSQTEDYVFTTCEPSGGGGGGGGDGNGNDGTVSLPIEWWPAEAAIWALKSSEFVTGEKNASEPGGGHFTGIVHQGEQLITGSGIATWEKLSANAWKFSTSLVKANVNGKVTFTNPNSPDVPINTTRQWAFFILFP